MLQTRGGDAVGVAESLYFDFAPYLEQEPQRILRDEGVGGPNALALLETRWSLCKLRARHPSVRFEVLDSSLVTG